MATTTTAALPFFSNAWADAARRAWNAGPSQEARAVKVDKYWEWIERAKGTVNCTLGLECAGLEHAVVLVIAAGEVLEANVVHPVTLSSCDYVLSGGRADWRDLVSGYDVGKTIMYRKLRLTRGEVLEFFKAVYYWTESLGCLQQVPTRFD